MSLQTRLMDDKKRMVSEHLMARGITNRAVIDAFIEVPREAFVPDHLIDSAYQDTPLPLDNNQTISQPYMVALMCQLLQLESQHKVLDIGTGSGYQAAILSRIVKEVITLEIYPHLALEAKNKFISLGYRNIHVIVADATQGYPEKAPYDGIKSAAASAEIPASWVSQLKSPGRLVAPITTSDYTQNLIRLIKSSGQIIQEDWGPVRFVPLLSETQI